MEKLIVQMTDDSDLDDTDENNIVNIDNDIDDEKK